MWENLGRALLPVENMLSIFFWLYKAQMALNSPASPYFPATPTWHPRGARSPSPQSTCRQLPPQWRLWTLAIQFQFFHTPQEWKKNPSGNERLGRPEQGLQPHIPSFTLSHYTFRFSSSVYRTRSNSLPDGDLSAALSKTYGCGSDTMISSFRNLLEQQWRLEQAGCSPQKPARNQVAPSLSPSATDVLEGFNGRGHIEATPFIIQIKLKHRACEFPQFVILHTPSYGVWGNGTFHGTTPCEKMEDMVWENDISYRVSSTS